MIINLFETYFHDISNRNIQLLLTNLDFILTRINQFINELNQLKKVYIITNHHDYISISFNNYQNKQIVVYIKHQHLFKLNDFTIKIHQFPLDKDNIQQQEYQLKKQLQNYHYKSYQKLTQMCQFIQSTI